MPKSSKHTYLDKIIDRISTSAESTSSSSPSGSKKKSHLRVWAGTITLFVFSALIISFFLKDVEWAKVLEATQDANLLLAVFASAASWLASWVIVTIISQKVVQWFHADFKFWDYFWVRGASFILQLIHPSLRTGSVFLFQKKKSGISWAKLLGTKLFLIGVFGWGFAFFLIPMLAIYHLAGYSFELWYLSYVIWFIFLVPGLLLFLLTLRFFWYKKDFLYIGKLLIRPQHADFWKPFFEAKFKHWAIMLGLVGLLIIIHFSAVYFRNIAFGVEVPLVVLFGTLSIASFVAGLPIGYAGFGTTTMAWVYFYGNYGSKEQIVALTLFAPAMGLALKVMIGTLCLSKAAEALTRMTESEDEAQSTNRD